MRRTGRRVERPALLLTLALVAIILPSAGLADSDGVETRRNAFVRRDLVVNRPELATPDTQLIDPLLVNPWGAAIRTAGLGGHFWLANAAGPTVPADPKCFTVTEYVGDVFDGQGGFVPIFQDALKLVTVEGPPIGQVFSGSASDFPVTGDLYGDDGVLVCAPDTVPPPDVGTFTGPAQFIVATENGKWAAWTEGNVNGVFGRMRQFVTVVDRSAEGALYRGLAITDFPSGNWLCAANFSQDRIDCLNSQWQSIPSQVFDGPDLITPFSKPAGIPNGPRKRYVPFNIQYLAGHFYVTYAELVQPGDQDFDPADPIAERACEGCGYVAVFNRNGRHLRTLESRDRLNAPGVWPPPRTASARSATRCWSATSGMAPSSASTSARASSSVISRMPEVAGSRSTASGPSSSATAPRWVGLTCCTGLRARTTRPTAPSGV
jgi:uncharacterized protein (TIGR03118 family)